MTAFGALVRERRHALGLTLAQLAREVEVAGRPVGLEGLAGIERGDVVPDWQAEQAIRSALGLPEGTQPAQAAADLADLGLRLRAARKERGLTLQDLKKKVEELGEPADVGDLSKYERSLKTPSLRKVQALAAALEVPLATLVDGDVVSGDVGQISPVELEILRAWRLDGLPGLIEWCGARSRRAAK